MRISFLFVVADADLREVASPAEMRSSEGSLGNEVSRTSANFWWRTSWRG